LIELEIDSYEQSKESAASTPLHEKCIAADSIVMLIISS